VEKLKGGATFVGLEYLRERVGVANDEQKVKRNNYC
jgi:hypothetical protein